jgi:hypothetical protein
VTAPDAGRPADVRAEPLQARRDRAAFVMLRKMFSEAVRIGGPNAKVHGGDVLGVLDMFADGSFDHVLDKGEDAVTGPAYPLRPSAQ